jgi:putative nucleotidyltransferase with HDIG domain
MKTDDKLLLDLFKQEMLLICNNMVKKAMFIAMVLFPLFIIVDYFLARHYITYLIIIRILTVFLTLTIYLLCNSSIGKRYAMELGMTGFLICALSIIIMIHFTGGYKSSHYAGLNIILFALCILVPLDIFRGIIVAVLMYLMYLIPIVIIGNIDDISILVNNNFFLISIMIVSLASLYYNNILRYREFASSYNQQKTNNELKELTDELEETNEKLLINDRLKTEFFTNVSHELRTPLTLILSPLTPLIEDKEGIVPESVKETMEIMQNNGLKLLKQINNLLDFAKLEAGRMRLNFQEVDLISFCKDIIAAVQYLATSRGLKLYFQYQMEDEIKVMIDLEQFEKVVMNLLHNAIKFTGEGGRITLLLEDHANDVELVVEDTGVGIPDDMLEIIFDRFAQVDGSSTRNNEGTGLGLSLAKEIVELHGGSINAESVIGKGSRFIVNIQKGEHHISEDVRDRRKLEQPVQYKKRQSDVEGIKVNEVVSNYRHLQLIDLEQQFDITSKDQRSGTHEFSLLVIDDNPDILKLMHFLLRDEFDLLLSSSGKEGLNMLREYNPDLVICDVMMPELDGYTFCREVKSDPNFKHIPIILVTARVGSDVLTHGIDSGASDYIAKPFDPAELKARIRSLLRTRTIEEALALANYNLKIRTDDLMDRQRTLLNSTVKSLVSTIEAKDNYTKDHSLRVSKYSMAIARKMGFADRELYDLELAALLHDVGKIAVPEEILQFKGKLTDEEFKYIKNHPANGANIIKPISEFKTISSIVLAHHEHYDGKGYPNSLYKDDIPLGARVMAVADAYDAMTSERPYRTSLSHNFTVKEIVRCSGTQFDPQIVDIFLEIHDTFNEIKHAATQVAQAENN